VVSRFFALPSLAIDGEHVGRRRLVLDGPYDAAREAI
jgi:hypothetical protein